eukprot:6435952-Alexandrium_andersonii.AAC.2
MTASVLSGCGGRGDVECSGKVFRRELNCGCLQVGFTEGGMVEVADGGYVNVRKVWQPRGVR